jgi:hypothetical protein
MGAGALLGVVIVLAGRFGIVGVWPVVPGALLFAVGLRVFGVFDADEWLRLKRLIRPEAGYES